MEDSGRVYWARHKLSIESLALPGPPNTAEGNQGDPTFKKKKGSGKKSEKR